MLGHGREEQEHYKQNVGRVTQSGGKGRAAFRNFARALVATGRNYFENDVVVWEIFSWRDCDLSTDRISPRLIHR